MTFWKPAPDPQDLDKFKLFASEPACVGPPERQFLMGGVGVAAAIEALEVSCQKPLLWITTHFISGAGFGDELDISIKKYVEGRSVTQAQANLRLGDRLVHRSSAALGGKPHHASARFVKMPDTKAPHDCALKEPDGFYSDTNLQSQFEKRLAYNDDATGREICWFRATQEQTVTAGLVAIVADFLLGATAMTRGGTSLDNTLRVVEIKQTEWFLLDTQIAFYENAITHGRSHIFAEDGTLMATASQTALIRN